MKLDWGLIDAELGEVKHKLACHVVVDTITSTNDWSAWSCGNTRLPAICLAEQQTSGRGRNNRKWVSPAGENIYLSLVWPFAANSERSLEGLSLAMGVALARVFGSFGVSDVKLKWPNDVLVTGRKIAGILIETRFNQDAGFRAIVGIGINYSLSDVSRREIAQPCTDTITAVGRERAPDRNVMAGTVIKELIRSCEAFQQDGFAAFINEWNQYDACRGQEVEIHDATGVWTGKVIGLNQQCGLRVLHDNKECVVYSADVSIRIR